MVLLRLLTRGWLRVMWPSPWLIWSRKVKLDGEKVIEFPKLKEFDQVTLKVLRWEEKDKRFIIKEAELVP